MSSRHSQFSLAVLILSAVAGCSKPAAPSPDAATEAAAVSASAASTFSALVDGKGAIARPTDFATSPGWTHIGSWAVVNANGEGNGLHDVYTTRDVVAAYRETGEFPDGAVLVKEVRGLKSAALTTGQAHWAADEAVWFVSVKDRKGRFSGNPLWGDGWGWALFKADDPAKQVATDYRKDCLGCHTPASASDLMYVYAYPSLGAEAIARAPAAAAPLPDGATPAAMTGEEAPTPAGDAAPSDAAFKSTCSVCHSDQPGEVRVGPSLAGVVGRAAGSLPGFQYSPAMKSAGFSWTPERLDAYLSDPGGVAPGNAMAPAFPQGVSDAEQRRSIIAYLQSIRG